MRTDKPDIVWLFLFVATENTSLVIILLYNEPNPLARFTPYSIISLSSFCSRGMHPKRGNM